MPLRLKNHLKNKRLPIIIIFGNCCHKGGLLLTANNNISANISHKGDLYYIIVSYYQTDGKRKQKWLKTDLTVSGNNKRKVEQKRLEVLQEWQDKLKFTDNEILFADFMQQWLEVIKNNVRPTTFYGYRQVVNYAIDPYFRERKITLYELKPYHIQNFYIEKMNNDNISANTILHYHANIHKALAYAVKTERIPTNPADRVELPAKQKHIANYYTAEELNILLQHSAGHFLETVIRLAIWFGLRRGEIIGLRWSSIDFDKQILSVNGTIKDRGGKGEKIGKLYFELSAKNASSLRSFPLSESMIDYLKNVKAKQDRRKSTIKRYNHNWDDFVCVHNNGDLITLDSVSYAFPKFCKQCGLKPIKLHELRHSNITLLLENGATMREAQEWAGHSSYNTTANIYSHIQTESKSKLTNIVDSALKNC